MRKMIKYTFVVLFFLSMFLNFHAEAERVTTDDVVKKLLEAVPEPAAAI